jgi:hypothetical protein
MPPLNQSLWALLISSLTALLAGASCTFQRGSNANAWRAALDAAFTIDQITSAKAAWGLRSRVQDWAAAPIDWGTLSLARFLERFLNGTVEPGSNAPTRNQRSGALAQSRRANANPGKHDAGRSGHPEEPSCGGIRQVGGESGDQGQWEKAAIAQRVMGHYRFGRGRSTGGLDENVPPGEGLRSRPTRNGGLRYRFDTLGSMPALQSSHQAGKGTNCRINRLVDQEQSGVAGSVTNSGISSPTGDGGHSSCGSHSKSSLVQDFMRSSDRFAPM